MELVLLGDLFSISLADELNMIPEDIEGIENLKNYWRIKLSTIKDVKLAELGSEEVAWAARQMLVLEEIKNDFSKNKPLEGLNIGACMHVTKETANLMLTLKEEELMLLFVHPTRCQRKILLLLILQKMILKYMLYGVSQMKNFLNILILF